MPNVKLLQIVIFPLDGERYGGDTEIVTDGEEKEMRRGPINPLPTVEYDGQQYKVRSRKTKIPDFGSMRRIEVLVWLGRYTIPRGYSRKVDIRLPRIEVIVR